MLQILNRIEILSIYSYPTNTHSLSKDPGPEGPDFAKATRRRARLWSTPASGSESLQLGERGDMRDDVYDRYRHLEPDTRNPIRLRRKTKKHR